MLKGNSFVAVAVIGLCAVTGCVGNNRDSVDRTRLDAFLHSHVMPSPPGGLDYRAAVADLNGDDIDEVVVYLTSREFCGSGGCHMLVLTPQNTSYREVSRTSITKLPIRVLDSTSHGWRSLSVTVQGGGIEEPYEAELRFDGTTYPTNPTVLPARPLEGEATGEILIAQPSPR